MSATLLIKILIEKRDVAPKNIGLPSFAFLGTRQLAATLLLFNTFCAQATLASVIMTAVLFSVDHHIVAPMWRASSECKT